MSKKKSRRAESTTPASTAVVAGPPVTGITTASSLPVERPAIKAPRSEEAFLTTPAGRFLYWVFRIFSSLQLAITLLSLFTLSLIEATLLESWHSAEIAKQLIYGTWWFTLLLFLLGTNILCAALKKMDPKLLAEIRWPWKKYQTGFLVTHLGLITLVFGGLLTNLGGAEGQIEAVDVPVDKLQPDEKEKIPSRYKQATNTLLTADPQRLLVSRMKLRPDFDPDQIPELSEITSARNPHGLQQWDWMIRPGFLPWFNEPGYKSNMTLGMRILQNLASPVRGMSRTFDNGPTVKLTNFYPWAELLPYKDASDLRGVEHTFPAVQLKLVSKFFPGSAEFWVTGLPDRLPAGMKELTLDVQQQLHQFFVNRETMLAGQNGVAFDLLTASHAEQVDEFLRPPPAAEMGKQGQLVLFLGSSHRAVRLPIAEDRIGKTVDMGDGLSFKLTWIGNLLDRLVFLPKHEKDIKAFLKNRAGDFGSYPMVEFELRRGEEKNEFQACARIPNLPVFQGDGSPLTEVIAFYHQPSGLWDRQNLHGAVHLLKGPKGDTYFRAFGPAGTLSDPGVAIDLADTETIEVLPWRAAVRTSFQPIVYFPSAVRPEHEHERIYRPRNLGRIGADLPPGYTQVLRGTLSVDGADHEFMVGLGRPAARIVTSRGEMYQIRYTQVAQSLPFEVTLHRARAPRDPGSNRFAAYESYITVRDKSGNKDPVTHKLYMNHTLDYGGWRFFQANFTETEAVYNDPELGAERRANVSGIMLGRDPGRYFKYGGTVIVVLGIFTMFYMKAYFFKPRGRVAARVA
jgi:hypothetical protein